MKVVLICGSSGLRFRGYADKTPKPVVQIGTRRNALLSFSSSGRNNQ
jgi:NDP-sugar pyrophosphorylase family protein